MAADKTFGGLTDVPRSLASGNEPVSALQTEVMSAVRGAISNVMAGQAKGIDLTGIDLDFSPTKVAARLPALLARPDQALAEFAARPAPRNKTGSRIAVVAFIALAAAGGTGAAWFQGVPGATQPAAAPAVAASVDSLVAPAAAKHAAVVVPAQPAKLESASKAELTPIVATVRVPAAAPQPTPDVAARARRLLESGQIREARALLLGTPDTARSDIALILARSFDGNYLQTLTHSDVAPDSAQARRWYQRWYDLASKDGSVPATVRLDRLLQSLP